MPDASYPTLWQPTRVPAWCHLSIFWKH